MGRLLAAVTKGKQEAPLRELVYGVEGVGKTTFAADAPGPIFLGEDGTKRLDVARFPTVKQWPEVLAAVAELTTEKHEFKTLVIDTADYLETVLWQHICDAAEEVSIEAVGGGYSKGYTRAVELWRDLLKKLTELQEKRGLNVIILAHAQAEKYSPPLGEEYDRFGLKIHKKSAALIKGWAESVLFAAYKDTVKKGRGFGKTRAGDSFSRVLYTTRAAAADAKNRYGLPGEIELSFDKFWALIHRADDARATEVRSECVRLAYDIHSASKREAATKALDAAKTLKELQRVLGKITATLEEQEESQAGGGEAPSPEAPAIASGTPSSPSPAPSTPGAQAAGPGPQAAPATASTSGGSPATTAVEPGASAARAPGPAPRSPGELPFGQEKGDAYDGDLEPVHVPTVDEVLSKIGKDHSKLARDVVTACAMIDEVALVSTSIGDVLQGYYGADCVNGWWSTAGGLVQEIREGKKVKERVRRAISVRELLEVLELAPVRS